PLRRTPHEELPARDVRRDAAAGDDRAGAGLLALGAAGRRADHGARRGGANLRPDRGDVRGALCRVRQCARRDAAAATSLYGRLALLHGPWRAAGPRPGNHSRQPAQSGTLAAGLRLRAALPLRDPRLHRRRAVGGTSRRGRFGPLHPRRRAGSRLIFAERKARMKPSISPETFKTLMAQTGIPLSDAQLAGIYEGYGYLESFVARVNAPLPREAEPALTFSTEAK